ncbi:MAG TPA: DMT family transporter [Burkholderiales bacterium]
MNGYFAAAAAVLIWAAYPVATRAAVTGAFSAQELIALRFGLAALLFLPYLALHGRSIGRAAWLRGVPLTLFQGAGMGALVICGLQFAPATHQAALGPGVSPVWVALLGLVLLARRPSARALIGGALCALGVLALALWSAAAPSPAVLLGDAMFLGASALGALYVLQLRNWGVGVMHGAAIVSLYSALVVVPWYLYSAEAPLWRVPAAELAWQALWQGVLIGCVSLIALNQAIARLGCERASACVALVPVLTAILARIFLGEAPSAVELAAFVVISAGVSIAALPSRPAFSPAARQLPARS